ncbi:methyl-accepting chemotaxis protein [Haloarcula amylolytica]|uniref:MCP domain-containing signal transducer n=1 Tax=Haloarcula amylolytica JCM 13557 TaxID=1227452 RepID=M0KXK8_9EURY|nr:methyl-accepting chemotaxis protein [Haloarcula amylolytica]EMA25992.1 MCP domain-containing signal transducer [Haloarcula amylolytica JCM 13557]
MASDHYPSVPDQSTAVTEERAVANAQGALDVVQAASATVGEQLAAIDDRATAQATDAQQIADDVSSLSATIEEIAATATEVSEQSQRATDAANDGREAASDAIDSMDEVRELGQAVAAEVAALENRVDRIADALAGIDRIADQTNMLALNASIEAARASDTTDTDGFAVVADEIKGLAEESQQQAADIETTLAAVREATDDTVAQLNEAIDGIDTGAEQVTTAMARLDDVADTVAETADGIASVSAATDEQATTSEAVAQRCETVSDRAAAIEDDLSEIRAARSEQTAMLDEIDDVLAAAEADRQDRLADAPTVPTGIDGLDDLCGGGLVMGGQAVLRYADGTQVAGAIAQLCATAVAADRAVSLTPPPSLDRSTLAAAFAATDRSLTDALDGDALFILDSFGDWDARYNVFDLERTSLAAANETTATRRDAPLVIVGNIQGEIRMMGEQAAREARYENDDGVFEPHDTVVNVINDDAVPATLGAFYSGAADQELTLARTDGREYLTLTASPRGAVGEKQAVSHLSSPPFLRIRDN